MRLFIAIELDETLKNALLLFQERIRRRDIRGNFTPVENLHLTLAFIGEYSDPSQVLDAMRMVSFPAFSLRLEGYGAFGDLWWAGTAPSPALDACVKKLRRALADADIPFDRKGFHPHITLLRRARPEQPPGLSLSIPQAEMTVNCLSLMRSDRGKRGMIYRTLDIVPAADSGTEKA